MLKVFLVLALIIPFNNVFSQGFSFYKENITMKIEKDYFYVTGIYYLKSDRSKSETLVYPFPVDSSFGAVDSIFVFNLTTNENIMLKKIKTNYAVFKIDFSHNSELMIQIAYRQKLLATRAEYILESTISWKKPLDQANYQLIVPSNMHICKFSIPPQDSIITKKDIVYYWEKFNYMPSENLIFEYKIK